MFANFENGNNEQSSDLLGTSQETTNRPSQVSFILNETEKFELRQIELPLHQCPICEKYYSTPEYGEKHEAIEHPNLPLFTDSSDDSDSNLENGTGTGRQEFLVGSNQVKKGSKALKRLAKRKNFMKGLLILGNDPGEHKCHYCSYKSKFNWILWAHVYSNHNDLDSETRRKKFCFICERLLSEYTDLSEHIDSCIADRRIAEFADVSTEDPTIEIITCELCGIRMNSSNELEQHLWEHAASMRRT